jgi:endonuclease/exonuclease/phosphatase family metal-dependent hydrolase
LKKILSLLPLFIIAACGQENINLNSLDNSQALISSKVKNQDSSKTFTVGTYDINDYFKNNNSVKQSNLNKIIHSLNSDVLALQGVSNYNEIKIFNDKYLKDLNYKFYSSQDAGSQNNSVILSKFDVNNLKKISTKDSGYPMKNLFKVNVSVNPNYSFTFYTVNFKSADTSGYSQSKRDSEIEEMKKYVMTNQKANFRENYLMVGNLNGSPTQPDLQTIIDPRSSGLSFHDVITEDIGADNSIFSYESKTKGKSRPDYVLVSPNMFNEYIYQSVTIHNQDNKKLLQDTSSHYPVTAKFNLPE